MVCILKAREPARIHDRNWNQGRKPLASGAQTTLGRAIEQYNFLNDGDWGRMFVRVCPYFPFSARLCLNQHHWIAHRLREQGIRFQQCT